MGSEMCIRDRSIGVTTVAGAYDKAFVNEKCASNPQQPITKSHGKVELFGSLKSPSYPAQIIPKTNCIEVSQNNMSVISSVRVKILVVIDVNANIIEQPAAAIIP